MRERRDEHLRARHGAPKLCRIPQFGTSSREASEAVQSQRRDDAAFMETKIAKSMVKTLHKQSTGSKSQHVLFAMEDVPEWIYVALHERLPVAVRALVGAKQLASPHSSLPGAPRTGRLRTAQMAGLPFVY